jgi:hypothetical protein
MIRQNAPAAIHSTQDTSGVTGSEVWTLTQLDWNGILVRQYGGYAGTTGGTSSTFSARVQTSPDGGTTFYDVVNFTSIVGTTVIAVGSAQMAVIGDLKGTSNYLGTTAAATNLAAATISHMPLFRTMKTIFTYGGTAGSGAFTIDFLPVDTDATR